MDEDDKLDLAREMADLVKAGRAGDVARAMFAALAETVPPDRLREFLDEFLEKLANKMDALT